MFRFSRIHLVAGFAAMALAVATSGGSVLAQDEPIGLVVGMRGQSTATAPGGEPRRLNCGDPIYAGERLETGEASRVSVLIGDVYAQLFVFSEADFGVTAGGTPDLFLQRGRMRVVDPRTDEGVPANRVSTPRAHSSFSRNDVDVYVLGPHGNTNSMLCSERTTISVERTDAASSASHTPTGVCSIASLDKKFYTARIPSERIGLREAPDCRLDIAAALFDPIDVASPGALPGIGDPDIGPFNPRHACDMPGSGCGNIQTPSDVVPDPFPDPLPGGGPPPQYED